MADRAQLDETQVDKLLVELYPDQKFKTKEDEFRVLFNPSEYVLTRSNAYSQTQAAGTSRPSTGFSHGNPDQLSLTLFFDGTGVIGAPGPITGRVRQFMELMRFVGEDHKPRYLRLRWGELDFRCYLKSATATFTLFNRKGEPIRARVAASFEEVIEEQERINKERAASPDLFRVWQVEEGESLDGIAHRAYGDVRFWRAIAGANGLDNPRALAAGQLLVLPPKER
jgi:hypothetical protein